MKGDSGARRPVLTIGIEAARRVRKEIGYVHPAELEIEVLAYMRGALVRRAPVHGARANLLRFGERGIIGVAPDLSIAERRWAIAHELGHFEAHAGTSFLGLCSGEDMAPRYQTSGREPEANAFAAELLMPADLFGRDVDTPKVAWEPIKKLADSYRVSVMAAALRFLDFTEERAAVVCMKDGVVMWTRDSKTFGERPARGSKVKPWTEAHAFFTRGELTETPQTVTASAWIADADDDEHLVEHVFAMPHLKMAMSLLWWKP